MQRATSISAWAIRGLLGLVVLVPFLPGCLEGVPLLEAVGEAVAWWVDLQCHRAPERSLGLSELAPCARCSGIYFGLGLGGIAVWPRLSSRVLLAWVGGACLLMLLDVVSETYGLRPAWIWARLTTGLVLALPVGAALAAWLLRRR